MSNAYTEFIERWRVRRGWSPQRLADESGLSKQVVSSVLNDERRVLKQRPEPQTVAGFAKAFGLPEVAIWQEVVRAMAIPLPAEAQIVVDASATTNKELLQLLADRLAVSLDDEAAAPDNVHQLNPPTDADEQKRLEDAMASELGLDGADARGPDPALEDLAADETPGEPSEKQRQASTEHGDDNTGR